MLISIILSREVLALVAEMVSLAPLETLDAQDLPALLGSVE